MIEKNEELPVQPNNLTGKEVADESIKFGKSVVKTAFHWTIAGIIAGYLKEGINKVIKPKG